MPEVDVLISSDVIEHLGDPNRLLAYIRDLSSNRTRTVLSTPERVSLRGPDCLEPVNPAHVREWSAAEFSSYLERSGLAVERQLVTAPFSFGPDRMTVDFVLHQLRRRRGRRTTPVVIARKQ